MFRHIEMASRGRPAKSDKVDTSFGIWLKKERDARGWAGEVLAEYAGTSQSVVSALERGAKPATLDMAERLAVALARDEWTGQRDRLVREAKLTAAGFFVSELSSPSRCLEVLAPPGFENTPEEAREKASAAAFQAFQMMYRLEMQRWVEQAKTSALEEYPELSGEAPEDMFPGLGVDGKDVPLDTTGIQKKSDR